MIDPWKDYSINTEYRISETIMDSSRTKVGIKELSLNVYPAFFKAFFYDILNLEKENIGAEQVRRLASLNEHAALTSQIFHYLHTEDRNYGVTPGFLRQMLWEKRIRTRYFGKEIAEEFIKLEKRKRKIILHYCVRKYDRQNHHSLFELAAQEMFSDVCFYSEHPGELLFSTTEEDDEENKAVLHLLCAFFLPVGQRIQSYWKTPLGVIGYRMRIGQIQVACIGEGISWEKK